VFTGALCVLIELQLTASKKAFQGFF